MRATAGPGTQRRENMLIAISSTGPDESSAVDERFGRCSHFVVADTEAGTYDSVENAAVSEARGAGVQAAQTVIDRKAEAVVTGRCGPNAFDALTAAGIKVYAGATGTVADAVEAFKQGQLTPTAEASDALHSGRRD